MCAIGVMVTLLPSKQMLTVRVRYGAYRPASVGAVSCRVLYTEYVTCRGVAQLAERALWEREAESSSLSTSINIRETTNFADVFFCAVGRAADCGGLENR